MALFYANFQGPPFAAPTAPSAAVAQAVCLHTEVVVTDSDKRSAKPRRLNAVATAANAEAHTFASVHVCSWLVGLPLPALKQPGSLFNGLPAHIPAEQNSSPADMCLS